MRITALNDSFVSVLYSTLNRRCFISLQTEVEGQNVPTPVKSLARFKELDISMGSHHTAVIVKPGCYVDTFGQNSEGQLGMGNTKSTTGPGKVQHLINKKVVVSIQIYIVCIKQKFLTTDNTFLRYLSICKIRGL